MYKVELAVTRRMFHHDYARYHALLSEIISGDLSIEDEIKHISFHDMLARNRNISLTDAFIQGSSYLLNHRGDACDVAKNIVTSFIHKYWSPLIKLCYEYVFDHNFQSYVAYADEYSLIFSPTKANQIYTLVDNCNNIVYFSNIYEKEIKCLDKEGNNTMIMNPDQFY